MTAQMRKIDHGHGTPLYSGYTPSQPSPSTPTSRSYGAFHRSIEYSRCTTGICKLTLRIVANQREAIPHLAFQGGPTHRRLRGVSPSATDHCGRPSDDNAALRSAAPSLRASWVQVSAQEKDQAVLLRACVRGGVSWMQYRHRGWCRQRKSTEAIFRARKKSSNPAWCATFAGASGATRPTSRSRLCSAAPTAPCATCSPTRLLSRRRCSRRSAWRSRAGQSDSFVGELARHGCRRSPLRRGAAPADRIPAAGYAAHPRPVERYGHPVSGSAAGQQSRSERAIAVLPRKAPAQAGEAAQGMKRRASRLAIGRTMAGAVANPQPHQFRSAA